MPSSPCPRGERRVRGSDAWHEGGTHWLRRLLFGPISEATTMFSDNQVAITLTRDHQYHTRTKHIDVRYHWIWWVIAGLAPPRILPQRRQKVKHFAAGLGLLAKSEGVSEYSR